MGSIFKHKAAQIQINQLSTRILNSARGGFQQAALPTSHGLTNVIKSRRDDDKATLMILHGGSGNASVAAWLFDSLTSKFNLILPDIIGGPGSSEEKFLNPQTDEYGEWLHELIELLDLDSVNILALSQGAYPALRYLERGRSSLNKLVLYAPAAFVPPRPWSALTRFFIPLTLFRLSKLDRFYKAVERNIFTGSPDPLISAYFKLVFKYTAFDTRPPKMVMRASPNNAVEALVISADNDIFFNGHDIQAKARAYFGARARTSVLPQTKHSLTRASSAFRELLDDIADFVAG